MQERFSNAELNALAERIHLQIGNNFHDQWMEDIYAQAEEICREVVQQGNERGRLPLDIKLDRILTHRIWGFSYHGGTTLLCFLAHDNRF